MTLDLWIAFGIAVLFVIPLARITMHKPRSRRVEDKILFVHPLNLEDFETVIDHAANQPLRTPPSSREFRKRKQQKIRLYAEHLSQMAHNAEVIQGWSHTAHATLTAKVSEPSEERALMSQIAETAAEIRISTLTARLQIVNIVQKIFRRSTP